MAKNCCNKGSFYDLGNLSASRMIRHKNSGEYSCRSYLQGSFLEWHAKQHCVRENITIKTTRGKSPEQESSCSRYKKKCRPTSSKQFRVQIARQRIFLRLTVMYTWKLVRLAFTERCSSAFNANPTNSPETPTRDLRHGLMNYLVYLYICILLNTLYYVFIWTTFWN